MNARRLLVCFVFAIAALAAATVIITDNAHGEGGAVDGAGRQGRFAFDVTKISHNDHVALRGSFRFSIAVEGHSVSVSLRELGSLTVTENVAAFGGPAVLRVQDGTEVHEYRGMLRARAVSNRHPEEAGEPDRIAVSFLPAVQTDPSFTFEGNVTTGDIAVTTTKSY